MTDAPLTTSWLSGVLDDAAAAVSEALASAVEWGEAGTRPGQHHSDITADGAAMEVLGPTGPGVLSEESGHQIGPLPVTVVLDPLDGSTNASFPANEPGTYWVSVVIDCCTSSDTVNISAATPPVAAFIITSEPCSLSALFENGSTGALTYAWQLRDGGTSAEENLSHEFSAPGPYTVLLIVSNACGSDTASQIVEIGVAAMFNMHGPSVI